MQEIIAGNIKRVRKEMGFTQAGLAESAGISSGYMCDIERSRRWPSADIITKLSAVLKVDPFQLLLPTEDSPYFDRHRTLTSFSRQVKEAIEEKMSEVFDNMMQPYGPLRNEESAEKQNPSDS